MKGHPWISALGFFFIVSPLVHVGVNVARGKDNRTDVDAVDVALMLGGVLGTVVVFQRCK